MLAQSQAEPGRSSAAAVASQPDARRPAGRSAFVTVIPVPGGEASSVPIGGDGEFRLSGLAPGRYRLAITSRPAKQTQGATFGERVNAGIQTAGSAVADGSGAASAKGKHDTAKNSISNVRATQSGGPAEGNSGAPAAEGRAKIDSGMPARISMNVTVARVSRVLEVDGKAIEVEVGPDGVLTGRVTAK